jgi:hypothetical protein
MPRFLPLATLAAIATTILLVLGGGQLEALAPGADELRDHPAEAEREMIDSTRPDTVASTGPQLEGSRATTEDPTDLRPELVEDLVTDPHVTTLPGERFVTITLVRPTDLPALLRLIRVHPWQREAIQQILARARLEMVLLKDVRNHEGDSWNELSRDVRLGHGDQESAAVARQRIAHFHASRIGRSDETFEEAAQLIMQDAVERISDLLDADQDLAWRSADRRWALRDLSFRPVSVRPVCGLGKRLRSARAEATAS